MLRFEIYSNAANSEHGLQRYPGLADLTETFRMWNIETRFVRQTFRSEEEINVASARHAKGVTVRGKSVREMAPETHVKGCLNWMRSVVARPERALHLEIENIRSANGAPLVFAQILARKQKVFLSGFDSQDFLRLIARPDLTCSEIPQVIASTPALKSDYLDRASRPTGFFALIQRIQELGLVNSELRSLLKGLLASRKNEDLKKLSEAQIINLALLHEYLERYEKLTLQFTELLLGEQILGDLPQIFELFTQGIPFDQLKKTFLEFTIEEKRDRIREKRGLVNELRLGLTRMDETASREFSRRLTRLVILSRARQDPKLYELAIQVPPADPEILEALAAPRRLFAEWLRQEVTAEPTEEDVQMAPPDVKQGLFELVVSLVFQGKFTHRGGEDTLPKSAILARNLLMCLVFDKFDIRQTFKLHPNLPVKGIAKNLAGKVPVSISELEQLKTVLLEALFPMGKLAGEMSAGIRAKLKQQEAQKKEQETGAYLMGAIGQINGMNYVLGRAGLTPLLRRAVLAAGLMLGLNMLESRDQIRAQSGAEQLEDGEEVLAGGYQLLMVSEKKRFFPLKATAALQAAALHRLMEDHVILRIRRMVEKKLKFLIDRHENRLFDVFYDHLRWHHHLSFSRAQLARLLEDGRLFDRDRLKEFGLNERRSNFSEGENVHLDSQLEGAGDGVEEPFSITRLKSELQKALGAFNELVQSYGRPVSASEGKSLPLKTILATLAGEERYDLRQPEVREILAQSQEADLLSNVVRQIILPRSGALPENREEGEALEIQLTGSMAYLALLREFHEVELESERLLARLKPARFLGVGDVDEFSHAIGGELLQHISKGDSKNLLHQAVVMLNQHDELWTALVTASTVPLLDQLLQETVLRLSKPSPPLPKELPTIPEQRILCLSASSSDQGRFSRIVEHPERRDIYATLSEMANWLMRFRRLRDELAYYREVSSDIMEIIAGFNLSAFDAPYINRYGKEVKELQSLLEIAPEEFTLDDLASIETKAKQIGKLVREAYDQERSVGLRDRWMGRVAMKLREMQPHLKPTFVDLLFEKQIPAPKAAGEEDEAGTPRGGGSVETYQTFSERVRNVVTIRERLEKKQVFVMSPAHTQKQLAMTLIDHIHRFKGMQTPIFVDTSLSAAYIKDLRARVPPYRLFDLNTL